jgi:hypothetical protein
VWFIDLSVSTGASHISPLYLAHQVLRMGLPLRMNNPQAMETPSEERGSHTTTNGSAELSSLPELRRKKSNIEEELKALSSVLDSVIN